MFLAGEVIPFDVKPYRAIAFAFVHPKQRFEAQVQLKQAVDAVLAPGYQVENPVTRARGYAELSRHAMPGMDVVLAEIESLKNRVIAVEENAAATYVVAPHNSALGRSAASTILGSSGAFDIRQGILSWLTPKPATVADLSDPPKPKQ